MRAPSRSFFFNFMQYSGKNFQNKIIGWALPPPHTHTFGVGISRLRNPGFATGSTAMLCLFSKNVLDLIQSDLK